MTTMEEEMKRDMSFNDLKDLETKPSAKTIEALEKKHPAIEGGLIPAANAIICPEDLKALIMAEIDQERETRSKQIFVREENAKTMRLKVHFRLEVKVVAIRSDRSFQEFRQIVFSRFGIDQGTVTLEESGTESDANIVKDLEPVNSNIGNVTCKEKEKKKTEHFRLRLFDRLRDEMLDDFHGKETVTLKDLKISAVKSFTIEEKEEGQIFEPFDPTVGNSIMISVFNIQDSICQTDILG